MRWRKGSLSGLPVSGAPGDRRGASRVANEVQVQQAVVSVRNDLDLFKAARLKRAELERALGADKAIGSAKGAAVVCGDFGATIDDFFLAADEVPATTARRARAYGGAARRLAGVGVHRRGDVPPRLLAHRRQVARDDGARLRAPADVPSTPPFGTRETQEEKRARKAAADEGKAAVDWIWYDRTKLRVQSAGVAPMFGDALSAARAPTTTSCTPLQ